jgi:hypothetical protein
MQTLHPGSPSRATPQTETLAHKLGITTHVSCLRHTAKLLGLVTEKDLMDEAVARGCFHFIQADKPPAQKVSEDAFSNEELALALLGIANRYDPWMIRVGAMMLSHSGNEVKNVVRYAKYERSEVVVRDIALAGLRYEPENSYWRELADALPTTQEPKEGVLPHHSRYVSIPGKIGPGKMGKPVWLRPIKAASLGYAA